MSDKPNSDPQFPGESEPNAPKDQARRNVVLGTIGAALLAVVGYVSWTRFFATGGAFGAGSNANLGQPSGEVAVGPVSQFANSQQPVSVTIRGKLAFVDFADSAPKILAGQCTHSGCNVNWNAAQKQYLCPCHGSIFARTGSVMRGPAAEPLSEIPNTIEGNMVFANV